MVVDIVVVVVVWIVRGGVGLVWYASEVEGSRKLQYYIEGQTFLELYFSTRDQSNRGKGGTG